MTISYSDAMQSLFVTARTFMEAEDLESLKGRGEEALDRLGDLPRVLENIGCLIAADEAPRTGVANVGSMRTADAVSSLLFTIGGFVDMARGFVEVGQGAAFELARREESNTGNRR